MKKIILFFILLWSVNCRAQTWQNVDGGVTLISRYHEYPGICSMVDDTIHHYLYVGGGFDSAGHLPAQNLARWDGKNWSSIGNFNDTGVFALCMYNDTLVIGDYLGNITFVDSAGNILNTFSTDGFVNALAFYKGELYAGGDFDEVNSVEAVGIARYNGVAWESVDSGMKNCCGNGVNWPLYVWNNKLYAAGSYYEAGDSLANNIASWNDTTWAPLGSGTNTKATVYNDGYVYSIGAYKSELYIGGLFDSAGGVSSEWLARWDGTKWDSVGKGINNPVYSFMTFNNNLYMSGSFDTAGGGKVNYVAGWNDTSFSSVDSGFTNGYSIAIDTFNKEIYFGGSFDSAGNIAVNNIVLLSVDSSTTAIRKLSNNNIQPTISPNPFSQQTIFQFSRSITNNSQLTLYDLTGREVESNIISSGAQNFIIKRNGLPDGMYFYRVIVQGGQQYAGKIIVAK